MGYTLLSPHITEDYLLSDDYHVSASSAAAAQQHQTLGGQAGTPVDS